MGVSFGGTAYVSYSRRDEDGHQVVTQLQDAFKDEWVDLKVDTNEVRVRDSFDEFIKEIGDADCVIVIFSESYFKSFYCMLELANVMKNGNAVKRIFPVFADEKYRFDGSKQYWIKYWEDVRDDWFGDSPPSDPTKVFGSKEECRLILDQLGASFPDSLCTAAFFDDFGRRVAATIPHCHNDLITWVKETYYRRFSNSANFDDSRAYLDNCSDYVQRAIKVQIDGNVSDNANDQLAYLCKVPPPELLGIFFKINREINKTRLPDDLSRRYSHELSTLLNKLLPSLFSPAYVPKLRDICDCEDEVSIIEIPHATMVAAELLMAGVDEREADFVIKEAQNKKQLYPGRFNLKLPPEGGSDSPTKDIDDDLANQLGLDTGHAMKVIDSCDSYLFHEFAEYQRGKDDYSESQRRELTQLALSERRELEEPRLYWILLMTREVSQARWDKIAKHIQAYYPQIVLLSLGGDFEQEKSEISLFTKLKYIIPANKPMSNH